MTMIVLDTNSKNLRAQHFYKKLGMIRSEDVMEYSNVDWTSFTVC